MALEAVVCQKDPLYFYKDFYCSEGGDSWSSEIGFENKKGYAEISNNYGQQYFSASLESTSSSKAVLHHASFNVDCTNEGLIAKSMEGPTANSGRRKRQRVKAVKNQEELENQRMIHIAVERNRRKQMNDYLATISSMMPASYVRRGDQASIVGGAINFVKELEQLLQTLQSRKRIKKYSDSMASPIFADFFNFPQYSSYSSNYRSCTSSLVTTLLPCERNSTVTADVEVTMVEGHANVKVLSERHPRQLLKIVAGMQALRFNILHLNVTRTGQLTLYSFSLKVEDDCQQTTVNEIAAAVYEIMGTIQKEAAF